MKFRFTIWMAMSFLTIGVAQQSEEERSIESFAESESTTEDQLISWSEERNALLENKIALNFADSEELAQIPTLNEFQIFNLLEYRRRAGRIFSHYELHQIKGFDKRTVIEILPYLHFHTEPLIPNLAIGKIWKHARHQVLLRSKYDFSQRRGFRDTSYRGSPLSFYSRYSGNYRRHLSWALCGQQDAGEAWFGHQRLGLDAWSGHLSLKDYGIIQQAILGDFRVDYAQGLGLSMGMGLGKSAAGVGVKRFARTLIPFSGSEENRFMRGLAIQLKWKNWRSSLFGSGRKLDAGEIGNSGLYSLHNTGLHRTDTEWNKKDKLGISSYGGDLRYMGNGWMLGTYFAQRQSKLPVIIARDFDRSIRRVEKRGHSAGFQFNRLWRNFNLYGELAFDTKREWASSIGTEIQALDQLQLSFHLRHQQPNYATLYGNAFGGMGNRGESGFYSGFRLELPAHAKLSGYLDLSRSELPSFQKHLPGQARDLLLQCEKRVNSTTHFYVRYRQRDAQKEGGEKIPQVEWQKRQQLRLHLKCSLHRAWTLESRWEINGQWNRKQAGWLCFQDVHYTGESWGFKLRYAWIQIDDYANRIYAYEHDLLYSFSIPAYYGLSDRIYVLLFWELNPQMKLQFRFAQSRFYDREFISSGPQQTASPQLRELSCMLRYKW